MSQCSLMKVCEEKIKNMICYLKFTSMDYQFGYMSFSSFDLFTSTFAFGLNVMKVKFVTLVRLLNVIKMLFDSSICLASEK